MLIVILFLLCLEERGDMQLSHARHPFYNSRLVVDIYHALCKRMSG